MLLLMFAITYTLHVLAEGGKPFLAAINPAVGMSA